MWRCQSLIWWAAPKTHLCQIFLWSKKWSKSSRYNGGDTGDDGGDDDDDTDNDGDDGGEDGDDGGGDYFLDAFFSENNIFQAMDTNGDGEVRRRNVSLYYMLIIRSVNLKIKYTYLASKYITLAFATEY